MTDRPTSGLAASDFTAGPLRPAPSPVAGPSSYFAAGSPASPAFSSSPTMSPGLSHSQTPRANAIPTYRPRPKTSISSTNIGSTSRWSAFGPPSQSGDDDLANWQALHDSRRHLDNARARNWQPSPASVAILKCAIAYLIASLFTFVPSLAALLSTSNETDAHGRVTPKPAYSAHMVATIVVYFNPARTLGSMMLSTRYCLLLAAMASVVSVFAIMTIRIFDAFSPSQGSKWDWISEMGDWIVCVLWIGGSMGWLAWAKVWVGNPAFNTGCSMAAVTLFTVIIKEGGIPKLAEVLLIVAIGGESLRCGPIQLKAATITNVVCWTVFPMSATWRLQRSMTSSLDSFSTLLNLLTSTFLLEHRVLKESRMTLADAIKSHGAAFKTLKADLAEAKHERLIDGRVRGKRLELYDAAIGSLTRLAQHLAGLRSSTRLQEALIVASKEGRVVLDLDAEKVSASGFNDIPGLPAADVNIATSVALFRQFRETAGRQMDTLVAQCDDAFDAIEDTIRPQTANPASTDLFQIRTTLAKALKEFTQSSSRAIKRVYAGPRRRTGVYEDGRADAGDSDDDASDGEVNNGEGPNETVFLLYFFLFTLEEFARELLFLLDTMTEISTAERMTAVDHIKSIFAPWYNKKDTRGERIYKQIQKLVPIDPSRLQPPLFPRNQPDAPGTLLTPDSSVLSPLARVRHWAWELAARLRQPDMRYAIKTGLAGAMLAAPAYTEVGRPIFLEYRGEWALIAFFATMSPTVGQTNFLYVNGKARQSLWPGPFLGSSEQCKLASVSRGVQLTCSLGAAVAVLIYGM
ncbi:hypothetical protein Q5752_006298 [Cryptotrichosporon argae]